MVKKTSKKITNNDDFPPLPSSPTITKIDTPTGTGQEKGSGWNKVQRRKGESVSPTENKNQSPHPRSTKTPSQARWSGHPNGQNSHLQRNGGRSLRGNPTHLTHPSRLSKSLLTG